MPFVLLALGIMFFVIAIQGTQGALFTLLKSEFTGPNNFLVWALAILLLGLAGYIKTVRPVTNAFLGLVFLVLILTNGTGFFSRLNAAVRAPVAPSSDAATGTSPGADSGASWLSNLSPVGSANAASAAGPGNNLLQPQAGNPDSYVGSIFNEVGGGLTGGTTGSSQVIDVFGPQEE